MTHYSRSPRRNPTGPSSPAGNPAAQVRLAGDSSPQSPARAPPPTAPAYTHIPEIGGWSKGMRILRLPGGAAFAGGESGARASCARATASLPARRSALRAPLTGRPRKLAPPERLRFRLPRVAIIRQRALPIQKVHRGLVREIHALRRIARRDMPDAQRHLDRREVSRPSAAEIRHHLPRRDRLRQDLAFRDQHTPARRDPHRAPGDLHSRQRGQHTLRPR